MSREDEPPCLSVVISSKRTTGMRSARLLVCLHSRGWLERLGIQPASHKDDLFIQDVSKTIMNECLESV